MEPKFKFVREYVLPTIPSQLYPFVFAAEGLAQWFADEVRPTDEANTVVFRWEQEEMPARRVQQKRNRYVRFEFLPQTDDDRQDPAYVAFAIEWSELTQESFLRIEDYSADDQEADLIEMWDEMVSHLRESVLAIR